MRVVVTGWMWMTIRPTCVAATGGVPSYICNRQHRLLHLSLPPGLAGKQLNPGTNLSTVPFECLLH